MASGYTLEDLSHDTTIETLKILKTAFDESLESENESEDLFESSSESDSSTRYSRMVSSHHQVQVDSVADIPEPRIDSIGHSVCIVDADMSTIESADIYLVTAKTSCRITLHQLYSESTQTSKKITIKNLLSSTTHTLVAPPETNINGLKWYTMCGREKLDIIQIGDTYHTL